MVMAGSVEARVDTREVVRGDTVLLTITVVGEKREKLPDIDAINGVMVDTVTRHSGSSFIQVHGQNKMEHTQTMTLEFKPLESMTIPAFQIEVDGKVETTSAIALKVVDATSGTKRKNPHFSLDMKLDKTKVYLGEPLVATVYFRQRTVLDIMKLKYEKPEFKAFFNRQLKGEKTYKKKGYTIHKLNYLLLAKKEGNLTLEPARARVAQRVRQRQAGGWFANVPKWSKLASDSLNVEVIKPDEAYDVVGDFKLNEVIDTTQAKAHKPIHLKMELVGEGSLEDFEGIAFDIDGVTIYSDDAEVNSTLIAKHLESHYSQSFVFIADHDFTIPSKTLRIFNYKTGEVKIVKTKAYDIKIEGKSQVGVLPIVHTKKSLKVEIPVVNESRDTINLHYWIGVGMFLLGSIITILFQYLLTLYQTKWKRKKLGFDGHEALRVLYPNIGKSKEVEAMVRKLYAVKNGEKGINIDRMLLKKMLNEYMPKK